MRAELDLFSGRPNPMWELSEEEERDVTARLERAPPRPPPARQAARGTKPGYRGIVLTLTTEGGRSRGTMRVAKGAITVGRGRQGRHFEDTVGLESYLLEMARARGYGDLVDLV